MKYPCTGVILAGGLATRYSGKTKAFLDIDGKKILDRIYGVFTELFEEIVLVTNNPLDFLDWDLNMGTDLFPVRSSLTGLHAGLFYASNPYAFFCASDAPFLKKALVETVLEAIEKDPDVAIPETSKGLEPLCAVYSKRCIGHMERHLEKGRFKIRDVFKKLRVVTISEKRLRMADPELASFFNVNTPEDLTLANKTLNQ